MSVDDTKPVLLLGQLAESSISKYQSLTDSATLHRLLMVHRTASRMDSARESWQHPLSPDGCLLHHGGIAAAAAEGYDVGVGTTDEVGSEVGSYNYAGCNTDDGGAYPGLERGGFAAAKCIDDDSEDSEDSDISSDEGGVAATGNGDDERREEDGDADEEGCSFLETVQKYGADAVSKTIAGAGAGDGAGAGAGDGDGDGAAEHQPGQLGQPGFLRHARKTGTAAATAGANNSNSNTASTAACALADPTAGAGIKKRKRRRRDATTTARPIRLKLSPHVAKAVKAATAAAAAATAAAAAAVTMFST